MYNVARVSNLCEIPERERERSKKEGQRVSLGVCVFPSICHLNNILILCIFFFRLVRKIAAHVCLVVCVSALMFVCTILVKQHTILLLYSVSVCVCLTASICITVHTPTWLSALVWVCVVCMCLSVLQCLHVPIRVSVLKQTFVLFLSLSVLSSSLTHKCQMHSSHTHTYTHKQSSFHSDFWSHTHIHSNSI